MYDLQAMGCVAASSLYRREPRLNDVIDTYCLIVPHVVPTGKQDNPDYERQICGTGIFIAYLLAKNYATETEIVEAFDQAFLDEAKKPDIQELVAKLLKEGRDAVSPLPRAELFPPQRDNAQLRS